MPSCIWPGMWGTRPPPAPVRDAQPPGLSAPGTGPARRSSVHKFDRWAASYNLSQLQAVLYGPVQDAVLEYTRQHIRQPGWILDVGCGTGRLPAKLMADYSQAHVAGVDPSTAMIKNAVTSPGVHRAHFAAAAAEHLPFADAVFDLVVITLSLSHWQDKAAGLAEIRRVMSPGATLVAACLCPAHPVTRGRSRIRRNRSGHSHDPPSLITAGGLRVEHVAPIRSVAVFADAALVAARAPARR